ncbi:MAG: C69 family dipeptidase [Bacteroidales bacterium]|jgi:dipeptidase|nr:C69 family dipeptidase [Bacteroidales bacterium]
MNKKTIRIFIITALISFASTNANAQDKSDWKGGVPEGCTSITVGKDATVDGSVITSHTDDSHRTRSWMDIQESKKHTKSDVVTMYKRSQDNTKKMPAYKHDEIGAIPQVESTNGYINTAYPSMNTKQVGIGESTFGGRDELQSDEGLIDCQRLCKLMLERSSTARKAINIANELTKKYGWNDYGECLTISDPKEVWHFEIVGPGKGKVGAVWVAQRVPDNHVAVNVNASTVKEINLDDSDHFMASDNIFDLAKENDWWNEDEEFRFCYAYAPNSRKSIASRRREWRVFDLLAPSLNLDPNSENYPFSVKPDKKINLQDLVLIFKDYYQGTPYDMRRNILSTNADGEKEISPLANPFMPYDQLEIDDVSGGWYHVDKNTNNIQFLGERTIARWYTMYGTIIQSRDWLPDEIGGVVWLAQDNIASSIYIPVYCSVTDLPESYKTPGRPNGFSRNSAWWAFNRLGTISAQRWGDMHKDIDLVWNQWQADMFKKQETIEQEALKMYDKRNPQKTIDYVSAYSNKWGEKVVNKAWELGDFLWTKYDEKF